MRRPVLSLVLILVAFSSSSSAVRAGLVYVSRPFEAFGTVDLTTGTYSQIGTTAVQLQALSFAPSGKLYGIGSDNHLYQVNTATGLGAWTMSCPAESRIPRTEHRCAQLAVNWRRRQAMAGAAGAGG